MKQSNSGLKKYIVAEKYSQLSVEEYLKNVMCISSRKRQALLRAKGVFVNGRSVHSKKTLKAGDMIAVRQLVDDNYGVVPQQGNVDILYEDEVVVVVNKPAGMLVHPAGQTKENTLANYLAGYFRENGKLITVRPVHRLDRDTSGCVLFAKKPEYQQLLEKQLQSGILHRCYKAITSGTGLAEKVGDGVISLPIAKVTGQPNRRQVSDQGQNAVTHCNVLKSFSFNELAELWLETGRTHQIRVHLAHMGHPVLGDRMYGIPSRLISRQALHASDIDFQHPVSGEMIHVQAEMPEDMQKALDIINM